MKIKDRRLSIYLPILFSIILVSGMMLGKYLEKDEVRPGDKLGAVIDYIEDEYVDSISRSDITETAIPDILRKLDPHSIYIPASHLDRVNEPLRGNFEGIGVRFNMQNDTILIVQVIKGGPSDNAGLIAGDRIISVNDTIVAGVGFHQDRIVERLRGKNGSEVIVDIARKGVEELLEFNIKRGKIPLYSIDVSYMINDQTGYMKINNFSRTTYSEFKDAMRKLKPLGLKKLLIDLRDNAGGYMEPATDIADEFLEKGTLIVYTVGKARPRKDILATSKYMAKDIEVVVLIDEGSASASEIFAGAIQDNDRGTIIGRRSYGKGLVQEQTRFTDGSAMRLTIARYYTPTGRSIQKSYDNGLSEYMKDIEQRYRHGELVYSDSIQFDDSLKYTTPGGKFVYGGGGIMPDIFVPIDTTGISPFFMRQNRRGYLYSFALKYSDDQRVILSGFDNNKQIENYLDKQNILEKFIKYSTDKGLKPDNEDIDESRFLIDTQLKAYISRNFLDNEGFYPFIRRVDKTLQEAITLLE